MSAHLDFGLVADFAYVGDRGKLYILGEFRYLNTPTIPLRKDRFVLVFRVTAMKVEGAEHALKVDLTDADGNTILPRPLEGPIRFGEVGPAMVGQTQAQVVMELGGVIFRQTGDHAFHIWVDNIHLGQVPLHVQLAPPKLPAPTAEGD